MERGRSEWGSAGLLHIRENLESRSVNGMAKYFEKWLLCCLLQFMPCSIFKILAGSGGSSWHGSDWGDNWGDYVVISPINLVIERIYKIPSY